MSKEVQDVSIIKKTKAISPLVEKAKEIVINSPETMAEASETLSAMNKIIDAATEEKEKITVPLNQALKAERGRWKPLEEMFENGIELLRKKMSVYQTEAKKVVQEEEDKLIDRSGSGRGKLKPGTVIRKMEELERPEERINGSEGLTKFKTVAKFEVMDVSLLPKSYILPNEIAIREAMKRGEKLDGVRYYTEEIPINFR